MEMVDAEKSATNWHDFTQDSTMHGLRYTGLRKVAIFRRVMWSLLIVSSFGYFCFASSRFLDDVIKKRVNTNIRVETAEELQFPTVTICNNNLWTLSTLYYSSVDLGTFGLFEVLSDLYDPVRTLPPPADKYNWSDPYWKPIANIPANETIDFLKSAAHPLEYSIAQCIVFGTLHNCSDVFKVVTTDRGYCFQFNSDGVYNATSAGKTGGISMVLIANVQEYSNGPSSYSEGFSVTFHDFQEVPMVSELSIGLSPGTEANVMLHKSATNRQPPPADAGRANCFDVEKKVNPLHFYKNYSYSACQVECKTSYVINKCGCRDPLMPELNDTEICTFPEMLYCSGPAMKNFTSDADGLRKCKCKDPCKDSEYTAKVSSTSFPSTNYVELKNFDSESIAFVQENWIMVNIFYGKMSFQQLEEEIIYDVLDMVANVGGTLGVCLGASVLTICEFGEFAVLVILKCIKKEKKVRPSVNHMAVRPAEKYTQPRLSIVQG